MTAEFLAVLDSVGASALFCTEGNRPAVLPGLVFKGVGEVGVPVSATDARRLIAKAARAPYGRGEATLVDTSVRRVWQLEPRQLSFTNRAGLLIHRARRLVPRSWQDGTSAGDCPACPAA